MNQQNHNLSTSSLHNNRGFTRLGKDRNNTSSELYAANTAPTATVLKVGDIDFTDQFGWNYWLCSRYPTYRSPFAQMYDTNDEQFVHCFARPGRSHYVRTNCPRPREYLLLESRDQTKAIISKMTCQVVHSTLELDHSNQTNRKTRCILMRKL